MLRLMRSGIFAAALAAVLASCGGGGSSGDAEGGGGSAGAACFGESILETNVVGPNSFLLFPNPQVLSSGLFETNTEAYARAYYEAIDPRNERATLAKWMKKNGFGTPAGPLGEVHVTFGDVRDLGYGREMHARQNPNGSLAFYVRNYLVTAGAGYGYSDLNLDAAIAKDMRWHIGTNAIEFSNDSDSGKPFVKFYNFDSCTGERRLTANLDGRGDKAMPGICISCHGGRADPLTPKNAADKQLFALVHNSVSQQRGDTQARLQMFDVNAFEFSNKDGHRRDDLQAALKKINRMILCSYPVSGGGSANADPACTRPTAGANEWQGDGAAEVIKFAYGNADSLPNNSFSTLTYVPPSWKVAGQETLFKNVVEPACMTCHRVRGTSNQDDISFIDYTKFAQYAPRIKAHVFDRGNMPLAKIVADNFWATSMPTELANWLESAPQNVPVRENGAVPKPGRPIADPGPDRIVPPGATTLSASNSLFASSYAWSFVSNPGGAVLSNAASATPIFTATADGIYVLRLVVSKNGEQSAAVSLRIKVDASLPYDPAALRFVADIKPVLQNLCIACHTDAGGGAKPPIFYTDMDRDGVNGYVAAVDDAWFYKELRGRINFTDIVASPLLRKPSGNHHGAGELPISGFDTRPGKDLGHADRADYDMFVNWIMNGAPH